MAEQFKARRVLVGPSVSHRAPVPVRTPTDRCCIDDCASASPRVVPYLDVGIRRVDKESGVGVLLNSVPASGDAPHGVRNRETLRFPVRDGSRVRYMSEAELAGIRTGGRSGSCSRTQKTTLKSGAGRLALFAPSNVESSGHRPQIAPCPGSQWIRDE